MLLLSILVDPSLPIRQRTEMFVEVHSNALLQEATAAYLGDCCLTLALLGARTVQQEPTYWATSQTLMCRRSGAQT